MRIKRKLDARQRRKNLRGKIRYRRKVDKNSSRKQPQQTPAKTIVAVPVSTSFIPKRTQAEFDEVLRKYQESIKK